MFWIYQRSKSKPTILNRLSCFQWLLFWQSDECDGVQDKFMHSVFCFFNGKNSRLLDWLEGVYKIKQSTMAQRVLAQAKISHVATSQQNVTH
jgi:hypothetical protein